MSAFSNLIRSPDEHRISFLERTYNFDQIALNRTLFDIHPLCGAVLYANDKHSFACAHDARIRNEQNGLLRPYGPLDGRIHARRKTAIGIDDIQFNWHGASFRVNGPRDSNHRAIESLGGISRNRERDSCALNDAAYLRFGYWNNQS